MEPREKGGQVSTAMAALGIVFGDLGTSPLYTMQAIVGVLGEEPAQSALGVLSLIFWTLLIIVSIKYCLFVMRADNNGEGGILALMSLVGMNDWRRGTYFGATMGLLGAALIYGDGIITPAISVLSALEGVNVATSALKPMILPLAVAILAALFIAQRFGTARIGRAFGPIMLIWFIVIGLLGLLGVFHHPEVLLAVDPRYALGLLWAHGSGALLLLGGVFLCATGGEALYADMGHIGRFPIRLAWYSIVLPSLVLSYAGQTGLLLEGAAKESNPFFLLAPSWAVVPLVVLATLATIIASQAIITGSFSMTRQGMQLGWLPGFDIRQTSDEIYGQIYVPGVNLMMAVATIGIAIGFRTSSNLAGAYGTAVATTMVLTTLLLFRAMYRIWHWPAIVVIPLASLFLTIDGGFFAANLMKVADGGWIPLSLGVLLFGLMVTWHTGVRMLRARLAGLARPADRFLTELSDNRIPRIPGTAVFLTRTADHIPAFVTEYVRNIGSLHKSVIALNIHFEDRPRILQNRCNVDPIIDSVWRVTLRYGFIEVPHIQRDLQKVSDLPAEVDMSHVVFFASRDLVKPGRHSLLTKWWLGIFAFLFRNAVRATDRFNLPQDRTVEIVHLVTL